LALDAIGAVQLAKGAAAADQWEVGCRQYQPPMPRELRHSLSLVRRNEADVPVHDDTSQIREG
jgi:hypothetical protein